MTLAPPKAATELSERSTNAARIGPAKLGLGAASRLLYNDSPREALGVGCEGVLERNVVRKTMIKKLLSKLLSLSLSLCCLQHPCDFSVPRLAGFFPDLT